MRRLILSFILAGMAVSAGASLAKADTIQFIRSRSHWTFNDQVYWNELPLNSPVANGTTVASQTHITVAINFGAGGPGQTLTQCSATCGSGQNWAGDFLPGQHLLGSVSSTGSSEGNLTLTFGQPIDGIGFSIQPNFIGTFTAEIVVFDGSTALGTFFQGGNSTQTPGAFASFMGVSDLTGVDITSVRVSIFDCGGGACTGGFSINRLLIQTQLQSTTPEPASLALLGSGVLALGLLRRKLLHQS